MLWTCKSGWMPLSARWIKNVFVRTKNVCFRTKNVIRRKFYASSKQLRGNIKTSSCYIPEQLLKTSNQLLSKFLPNPKTTSRQLQSKFLQNTIQLLFKFKTTFCRKRRQPSSKQKCKTKNGAFGKPHL